MFLPLGYGAFSPRTLQYFSNEEGNVCILLTVLAAIGTVIVTEIAKYKDENIFFSFKFHYAATTCHSIYSGHQTAHSDDFL